MGRWFGLIGIPRMLESTDSIPERPRNKRVKETGEPSTATSRIYLPTEGKRLHRRVSYRTSRPDATTQRMA